MKIGLFVRGRTNEGAVCAFGLVGYVGAIRHDTVLYSPELNLDSDAALWERFDRADWAAMDWLKREAFDLAIFYGIGSLPAEALRAARRGFLVPSRNLSVVGSRRTWISGYDL